MEFRYEPQLREHMMKHNKKTIVVEMVELSNSDLDVTELHVHFVDSRMREQFLSKKRYRLIETDLGEVLLPPYPLTLADTVTFGLKKFLFVSYITHTGIKV